MLRPFWAVGVLLVALASAGCKDDPAKPEYWGVALDRTSKAKDRVRMVDQLRGSGHLNPAFLAFLHQRLTDEKNSEVKGAFARALAQLKDPSSVDPLTSAMDFGESESASVKMNKEIAGALVAIGDARAAPTLVRLLKSRDNFTRIEAIHGLGIFKAKEAQATLLGIAQDESADPYVNKKAIQALGNMEDSAAIPALTKLLFKERKGVSFYQESSFALYQIGQKSADAVLPILTGEDKATFAWASQSGLLDAALYAKSAQLLGDLHDKRGEKALISKLAFQNPMEDVRLFVRMRAADALGRMRSKAAVGPLSALVSEEEPAARSEYVRALVRIGDPAAVPALLKAAGKGAWEARQMAIWGVANLGDDKATAELDKLEKSEAAVTHADCKEHPEDNCQDIAALAKKREEAIATFKTRTEAAAQCHSDAKCWAKKLDDKDVGVRERAAYELGRLGDASSVPLLMQKLTESNLDARLAVVHALDGISDEKGASLQAKPYLTALDEQIAKESGSTQFVRVNEDLKRLAVKLRRG